MANVINRTTLEYLESVNTPDYPVEDWIINPDLSGVAEVPRKYWKIVGDDVVEMDSGEKALVDASELAANKSGGLQLIKIDLRDWQRDNPDTVMKALLDDDDAQLIVQDRLDLYDDIKEAIEEATTQGELDTALAMRGIGD